MTWLLIAVLFVAFLIISGDLFSRYTRRNITPDPDIVMKCSKGYFLSVLAADTLFLGAAIWSVESAANPPIILPIVLLLFCLWLSYELAWTIVVRVEIKGMELVHRTVIGGIGTLRTDDIQRIVYQPKVRWFLLGIDGGDRLKISRTMTSLPEFSDWILHHVKEDRIEGETQDILAKTRDGSPPGIWL